MHNKLVKAFALLKTELSDIRQTVEGLQKIRAIPGKSGRDGKDGEAPELKTIVQAVLDVLPEPEKVDTKALVGEVLSSLPKPKNGRDGRDAPTVNVSDVAAIVLAKIPKPKDGKDGPVLEDVVAQVNAQIRDGEQGPPGPPGPAGKNGTSVTDVELTDNELFVFLDGKKKKAGTIKMPRVVAPFNPGNAGGGGSARPKGSGDDAIYVARQSDFPTQNDTTVFLREDVPYIVAASFTMNKKFEYAQGASFGNRSTFGHTVTYTGTEPWFNGTDADFYMHDIRLDAGGQQLFNVKDTVGATKQLNLESVSAINVGSIGTIESLLAISIINSNMAADQGITFSGTIVPVLSFDRLAIRTTNAAFVGVDLGTTLFNILELNNFIVNGVPGAIGISGLPDSGNVPVGRLAMVSNSEFLGGVTPLQGVTDDELRWEFFKNNPIRDTKNQADIYLTGGSETITISAQAQFEEIGTPVSPGVSWASDIANRFDVGTDGVLTYIGERDTEVFISGTATVEKVGGGADQLEVRIAKNWVALGTGLEKSRAVTQNANPTSVPIQAIVPLTNGDDIRAIFANNSSNVDIIASVTSLSIKE